MLPAINPAYRAYRNPLPPAWQIGVSVLMTAVGVGGLIAGAMRSAAAPAPTPIPPPTNGELGGAGPAPGPGPGEGGLTPEQIQKISQAALDVLRKGKPHQSTTADIEAMRAGHGEGRYTTWFTSAVEDEIIALLADYRTDNNVVTCSGPQPFEESEAATRQILESLYPSGAPWEAEQFPYPSIPYSSFKKRPGGGWWSDTTPSVALWRYWLWKRVMLLADRYVCNFHPIT